MAAQDSLNYFTCTLGEAVESRRQNPPPWETIPELLEWQAEHRGDEFAVGLPFAPTQPGGQWTFQDFSFATLLNQVQLYAKALHKHVITGEPVGLLCTSGEDFLFAWLGLIYLGMPVLLIATEVPVAGVGGLLLEVGAKTLFHDEKYARKAQEAIGNITATGRHGYSTVQLSKIWGGDDKFPKISSPKGIHKSSIAYYHHTSGTSSGTPKAIPTSHFGAAGALPMLKDSGATFTTTPLFHGGPADCFRAWTSGATIWLFPGRGDVPITPRNIIDAFNKAKSIGRKVKIAYFTAVPYIIEALAATDEGVQLLRSVETVGTGGAALSAKVGDELAKFKGVPLISRYGAAECGFVLSSRRDYAVEKDWQYLRVYQSQHLQLIRQAPPLDNVSELKLKDWPFMAKPDPDNTYNTCDCFEQHPDNPNLYRYHSRSDAQIALSTGLKFDPNFIETQLFDTLRDLHSIRELYVFGKARDYPGLFVIRHSESDLKDPELTDQVWGALEILNDKLPSHAKVRRSMVVILPGNTKPLARSSKGTLLRGQVDEELKTQIGRAYQRPLGASGKRMPLNLEKLAHDVRTTVREIAFPASVAANTISTTEDLFKMGVDSQYAMVIRERLQIQYAQVLDVELSPMWVYECGSIDGMIRHIIELYQGEGLAPDDAFERMLAMRNTYGHMWTPGRTSQGRSPSDATQQHHILTNGESGQHKESVILTGVTGLLGVHILDQLRRSDKVREIHCLIRGADQTAAEGRVHKALLQKHLASLEGSKIPVHIHTCKLSEPELGLTSEAYDDLSHNATLIIHAAWEVNFNLPLKGFEDSLKSLQNLLSFAVNAQRPNPPPFVYCSSTANVLGPNQQGTIGEKIYEDPSVSPEIGYARSKWVAEGICADVYKEHKLPIAVVRVGQLCGDSATGTWNVTEAWPLMLSSLRVTGSLPRLDEKLNWLKVDVSASAVIEISQHLLAQSEEKGVLEESVPVYHVVNSHQTPTWDELLKWVEQLKPDIEILPPAAWVEELDNLQGKAREHPARKLLGLWKNAYGNTKDGDSQAVEAKKEPVFEMTRTLEAAPVLRTVKPLDEAWFAKVWDWVEKEV